MIQPGVPSPQVTYQEWNLPYRELYGEEYGEAEARRRYEAREGFWVLLGDPASPHIVVEIEPERYSVLVAYLDALRRKAMTYLFVDGKFDDPDLMLLEQHHQFTYDTDDPDAPLSSTNAVWVKADGHWYRRRRPPAQPLIETRGQVTPDQLALLIEPFPAFGDWAGVTRVRELPVGDG